MRCTGVGARLSPRRRTLELDHFQAELLRKLVVDGVLHNDAVSADAGLASVAELGRERSLHGHVQVRILCAKKGASEKYAKSQN